MSLTARDLWSSGDAYEDYVGRWSRLVAPQFIKWIDPTLAVDWIDVGCGTGALTSTVLELTNPRSVICIDRSVDYVQFAVSQVNDRRAQFTIADAQSLPIGGRSLDYAVSSLMLNFVGNSERAVSEMVRVTKPDGRIAAYVWDYAGEMQMLRHFWDAATWLDSAATQLDEGHRFPICAPSPLQALFEVAGLQDIEVAPLDVDSVFADFEDFWRPFESGQGPAPGYVMSRSELERKNLKAEIRASLPIEQDGSICLIARAWAVKGRVPAP